MSSPELKIVHRQAQTTAVIRVVTLRSQIQEVMGPAIHEVLDVLKSQGIAPKGPLMSRHLRLSSEEFDFEVGFPIDQTLESQGRVYGSEIPEALTATCYHQGAYEGLYEAWKNFGEQLQSELSKLNLTRQPELWESYLRGPEYSPDPSDWLTELNLPLS